ncbi:HAD family hydrolase [Micromonospora psammae]|uniref:HAD family hydrolase n=1 Tax=Micromonospora sp. CPCC 205556 TaxID=3122398 RepID=UPI002FF3BBC7
MSGEIPTGVLFDVDGTLVDTTYLHTVSWWEALRQADHPVPMALIHRSIGMGSDKLLDHLLGPERNRGGDGKLRDAHDSLFAEYWERLTPLPGAADLLRACAARGLRVVLATSAAEHEVTALRAALDADDVIDTVTSSADAEESKPAPDILVAALEQSGLDPRRVVFVGDSVWDVAAAGKLDIPCVGLTCGGTSRGELAGAGAVAVYDDPAALLAALADSPLAAPRPASGQNKPDSEA